MTFNPLRAYRSPQGGKFDFLTTTDGIRLRYAQWSTRKKQVLGTILVLQGRREFIEKYYETIADLLSKGFNVTTLDWRGQGMSDRLLEDRNKGHIENFSQYVSDLDQLVQQIILPGSTHPLLILGHSMGGHIALRYMHDHPKVIARAVLTAPMIDIELGPMAAIARLIVSTMTRLGRGSVYAVSQGAYSVESRAQESSLLSSDPERLKVEVDQCQKHPELALGGVTYGWLKAAFRSVALLRTMGYPQAIKTPTLIVTAGMDKVVSNATHESYAKKLWKGQHMVIHGARHEILMERDDLRDQFWTLFDRFMNN